MISVKPLREVNTLGGLGSGGYRHGWRNTVESYRRLDVREMYRKGELDARAVSMTLEHNVNGAPVRYTVALDWTPCTYGGGRPWFRCPNTRCGRRCAMIYRGASYFACRKCHRLAYPSQREDASWRARRMADKIYARFGVDADADWIPKPPRMRWTTFNRLCEQAEAAEIRHWGGFVATVERLTGRSFR